MATKLYPPYIEGTIPAFCTSGATAKIVVPFSMNRAVGENEIAGFVIKIKTVSSGILLGTIKQMDFSEIDLKGDMTVNFLVPEELRKKFMVGQYYKIQMAYIDMNGTVGYYSTVGVIKYTTMPKISIAGMDETAGSINLHKYTYIGNYSQEEGDTTEKMYSSHFVITDAKGLIVHKSPEQLHNTSYDVENYESSEEFLFEGELEENKYYYIQFVVTTSNNMIVKSKRYRITARDSIEPQLKADLIANLQFEDGHVDLYLKGHKNAGGTETVTSGNFVILRMADNKPGIWNEVNTFSIQSQMPSRLLWRDFTIEQGVTYTYAVKQYNEKIYSNRIESNKVYADFEDAFLYDGERQLKIRFNPKVSSFKIDVQENKSETIGNKFPFILRNGNVKYREFPISGLISYQMDENQFFMAKKELGILVPTIDLTSENIAAERMFKMEVLEWLNNGKEKIFRSPTEGNFIVRLMNVSLSPNDTTGRMLHTFSCTAYEIADFTYHNMANRGFISIGKNNIRLTSWKTIELAGHDTDLDKLLQSIKNYVAAGISPTFPVEKYSRVRNYYLMDTSSTQYHEKPEGLFYENGESDFFEKNEDGKSYVLKLIDETTNRPNAYANTIVNYLESIIGKITYPSGIVTVSPVKSIQAIGLVPGTVLDLGITTVQIGATGAYKATFEEEIPYIKLPDVVSNKSPLGVQGSITYGYEGTPYSLFDQMSDIMSLDVPCKQWIGTPEKLYYDVDLGQWGFASDLVDVVQNCKYEVVSFTRLHFIKRPIQQIFHKNGINYVDMYCTQELGWDDLDPFYVYAICNPVEDGYKYKSASHFGDYFFDAEFLKGYYVNEEGDRLPVFTGRLLDGKSTKDIPHTYKDSEYFDIDPTTGDVQYSVSVYINGDQIDLSEIERYTLVNFDTPITSIDFRNGVVCEASYQLRETIYSFENEKVSPLVYSAKQNYLRKKKTLQDFSTSSQEHNLEEYPKIFEELREDMNRAYEDFIYKLDMTIKEYEEVNATV